MNVRRGWAGLVGAAAGLWVTGTYAQSPALQDCHGIGDAVAALACYDRMSGRKPAPVDASAPAAQAPAAPPPVPSPVANEQAAQAKKQMSMIDTAWDFNPDSTRYDIRFFHENYLLLARYTDHVNTAPYDDLVQPGQQAPLDSTEAKFQISFKARLWTTDDRRWGVWAAYTQQNQWQVYNGEISRPFRETNYMPEVFASYRPGLDLGSVPVAPAQLRLHPPVERQDRRPVAQLGPALRRGRRRAQQLRAPCQGLASHKEDASKDDNPDITDFYGHGSLTAVYKWRENSVSLMGRGNLSKGKGAGQLTWISPEILGALRGYVQIFSGYGESMIDYNWKQTTIGFGIALSDGL